MTTTSDQKALQEPTYGNWGRRAAGGMYGLGVSGTLIGFGLIIGDIVVFMLIGMVPGLVFAMFGGLGMALLLIKDKHGRNLIMNTNARFRWGKSNRNGSNLLRQGPLTPRADYRLPGVLGKTTVTEYFDGLGRAFAMLSYRAGYHVVVLDCHPDGSTNVDEDDINQAVAQWGEWLAQHSTLVGIIGASITIETAPDTGNRLKREIELLEDPGAPELAKQVMAAIKRDYPVGSAVINAWISLSFAETGRIGKARTEKTRIAAMGLSLGTELPNLIRQLGGTGAGVVSPLDVQGLCEITRVVYDPGCGPEVEQARSEGVQIQAMSWDTVGPVSTENHWGFYVHDSGVSITSAMTLPPRQNVPSVILKRLLQPQTSHQILRKRVSIIYRPLPQEKASNAVEKDLSNAIFTKNAASKPSANHEKAVNAAKATAQEEAHGAGLDDFALLITTTVASVEHLEDAKTANNNLSASARLRTRIWYGAQDFAFAMSMPFGLQPAWHINTPKIITKVMS